MRESLAQVRVRFAPSPTGGLHVGGVRTLIFNWLYARKFQGSLVLRMEDTDPDRSTAAWEKRILSEIKQIGIEVQEGPEERGPYAPYRQSERSMIYTEYAKKLLVKNQAYYCFCDEETLQAKRKAALREGKPPLYDGTCAKLSPQEVQQKFAIGQKAGLRFRAFQKDYVLHDQVRGKVYFPANTTGDFLIIRSPQEESGLSSLSLGLPIYHFSCVVDDICMKMTHVIRSEEHLSNTLRQLMLYEALDAPIPEFAHAALVLYPNGQKLSKRQGEVWISEYLAQGYLPEALINFLLFLGWSPSPEFSPRSGHPEILSLEEMIAQFELSRLHRAGGIFDLQKLKWMNRYYLQSMPLKELTQRVRPFFEKAGYDLHGIDSSEILEKIVQAVYQGNDLLSEIANEAEFFFKRPQVNLTDFNDPQSKEILKAFSKILKSHVGLVSEQQVKQWLEELGSGFKEKKSIIFKPIRMAVSGKVHGPEMKWILSLIPLEELLHRIESVL